jgi:WD40 repeat protein
MDYDELAASSELGPALNGALDDSQNLIVVASLHAAKSPWVNKEVSYFRSRSNRPVFALIASGVPNHPEEECLPENLRGLDAASQPIAPNLQKESFSRAFIRLVAAILDIPFDDLWQRERRRIRTRFAVVGVSIPISIVAVIFPTLVALDRYDRGKSVEELISETQNEVASGRYENALKIALEGLPVATDVPWALGWSDSRIKGLESKLAGAAQLASVVGGTTENGTVTSVSFSPNGQRILTSNEAGTATVWDSNSFSPIAWCAGNNIIPDNRRILQSTPNGVFKPGSPWIRDSRFSDDGSKVISSGYFGKAWVWTIREGKCNGVVILNGHLSDVRTGAFSPDGRRAVTTSDDYTVRIWDAENGRAITSIHLPALQKPGTYTTDAEFSPDGKNVVFSTSSGLIAIADSGSGEIGYTLQKAGGHVSSVRYNKDGNEVVSASEDGSVAIWNIETKEKRRFEEQSRVNHAEFSRDGKLVVTASSDGTAQVWDVIELRQKSVFRGHTGSVKSAAFAPDRRAIVTGSTDKTVRTWSLTNATPSTVVAHSDSVLSTGMSRNQAYLVSGGGDGSVVIWKVESTGGLLQKLSQLPVENAAVTGVAYGGDTSEIATTNALGDIAAWNLDANWAVMPDRSNLSAKVMPSERGKTSIAVSDDARLIAGGSDYDDQAGKNNRVWEVATGRSWPLQAATRIVSLDFGRNYLVAAASENGMVQVWDGANGSLLHTLGHNMGSLTSAYFNSDSSRLAVAARDASVTVFNLKNGLDILRLVGHDSDVNSARFSPDGKSIVTASGDLSVRVWDADTGDEIVRFNLDQEPLDAHFAAGSDHVIASLNDGKMTLLSTDWTKLRESELVKSVCERKIRLTEKITLLHTSWRNRIESVFSPWFRQVDPCK